MQAKTRDLIGSILMLIFVAVLWIQRDYTTPFGAIFPDIMLICTAILVVITLVMMFTKYPAMKDNGEQAEKTKAHWLDMAIVGGILFLWTFFLRQGGFIIMGFLGFASISWFLNERRNTIKGVMESILVGVFMVALLVIVFEYLLKVPLPKGIFFE